MKKINVLLVVGLLLFANSAHALVSRENSNSSARISIIKQWLSAGDEIVQKTKDKNAGAIMKFLRESFYLCEPVSSEDGLVARVIKEPSGKYFPLCVVPLLPDDRVVGDHWRRAYDGNQAAFFLGGEQPLVVLKNDRQFSKTWQGIVLIHEGGHALSFAGDMFGEIKDPLMKKAYDELYAYQLETSLVEKIGGPAYRKLLQEEMIRIKDDYLKRSIMNLPDYNRYQRRLDAIFGKSNSRLETGVRGSIFWIDAFFCLVDNNFKSREEREKRKLEFLWSAYKNGNMQ